MNAVIIADTSVASALRGWSKGLRKTSRNHHAVWVMLTAEERYSHRDLMNGIFAGYLLKPLRRSTLLGQLTAQDDTLVTNAVSSLRALARQKSGTKPFRILVAEDNPVNMLLVSTMLSKAGHVIEETYNGMDALKRLLDANTYDLAIIDVNMPGMSGIELARRLRQHEKDWGVETPKPLLALTGSANSRDREACLRAGINAHLAKPFDQHDLLEAIAKIVNQRAA
jgi:CheY-like chemotaxis protein